MKRCLLVDVLKCPHASTRLDAPGWDLLIRQARRTRMLPLLRRYLDQADCLDAVPEPAARHLASDWVRAERHAMAVRWEVGRVQRALVGTGVDVVLLKGAAYTMAGLSLAVGRFFGDIDILVPRVALERVEQALIRHGWMSTHLDAYDQKYYRQWMHELPPMRHVTRKSVLDVHHNILPETARLRPDAAHLLSSARLLNGVEGLRVLSPVDMVLHSATHLFHEGELEHGLRDLVDLHELLTHFGRTLEFWQELWKRAEWLGLERPLYYALRYTERLLGTAIPPEAAARSERNAPLRIMRSVMDSLFVRGLSPDHASCADSFTGTARWLLYVRSHYLRMPAHLLIPHLARKALRPPVEM